MYDAAYGVLADSVSYLTKYPPCSTTYMMSCLAFPIYRLPSGDILPLEWPIIPGKVHLFNTVFTWKTGYLVPGDRGESSYAPGPEFSGLRSPRIMGTSLSNFHYFMVFTVFVLGTISGMFFLQWKGFESKPIAITFKYDVPYTDRIVGSMLGEKGFNVLDWINDISPEVFPFVSISFFYFLT